MTFWWKNDSCWRAREKEKFFEYFDTDTASCPQLGNMDGKCLSIILVSVLSSSPLNKGAEGSFFLKSITLTSDFVGVRQRKYVAWCACCNYSLGR